MNCFDVESCLTIGLIDFSLSNICDEEMMAKDLIERGEIDQAIANLEEIKPESSRIFRLIGTLYAQRKGDYDLAIIYYQRALEIQDEVDNHDEEKPSKSILFVCRKMKIRVEF